ncbi:MAG: hypothetical protein HY898_25855 [Deltaproteobacteria bacterium]|nr:hypothetical protein [Deltaproteobacteria bacterium]
MQPLRAVVTAGVALASTIYARGALAEPAQSVALHWRAEAPGCIDREALAASVESTLGRPVFHSAQPPVATVDGSVSAFEPAGYRARIVLRSSRGVRVAERDIETRGEPCSRLDDSIAVVITLMIDELRQVPSPWKVPRVPPRQGPELQVSAAAGVGASRGLLPSTAPFGFLRAEGGHPSVWPIALSLRGWAPSEKVDQGVGARFTAWSADLGLCPTLVDHLSWKLGVCGGAGVLTVGTDSVGLVGGANSSKVLGFGAASGSAGLRIAGPIWLRLDVSAMIPFRRLHYWYTGRDGSAHPVHEGSVGAPMVSLGVQVHSGS